MKQLGTVLLLLAGGFAMVEDSPTRKDARISNGTATYSTETERFWPSSYGVSYSLKLPYTTSYQDELEYEVEYLRRASEPGEVFTKITSKGTPNVLLHRTVESTAYMIHPRMNELVCDVLVGVAEGIDVEEPLPDLRGWEDLGETYIGDDKVTIFELHVEKSGRRMEYRMYVDMNCDEPVPLRLHMLGRMLFDGAHYDEYLVEYSKFDSKRPKKREFDVPPICTGNGTTAMTAEMISRRTQSRMASLPPVWPPRHGEEESLDSLPRHRRSLAGRDASEKNFLANRAMIESHNAGNSTFRMGLNRFADWHFDALSAVLFPERPLRVSTSGNPGPWSDFELPYEALVDPASVPRSVDWRGTVVGGAVKDQAICGSCWAFAAVGAMEGAYNKKYPEAAVQLSEQQVSDCSWDMDSNACAGGEAFAGIARAAAAGGIALAKEYGEYLGSDDWCRADMVPEDKRVKVKGFAKVPRYDDRALMEAIYSHGAVAVSMHATEALAFYKDGIFRDPLCSSELHKLNHAVLAVGYGTDEQTGEDFWLIKNSWSSHWGDGGYLKISRWMRACGITADPIVAIV